MERLTFGYGVGRRQVDRASTQPPLPPREEELRPVLPDPLPGESSDWAYFGLLAFTAVLFFRPQDQLPFLEPLHLAEVAAIVGLVAMSTKRLVRGLPVIRLTREFVGLLAFGFVLVATTPFSFWPGGSVEVITGLYLKALLIVALIVNALNTPLRLRRFTWLIVVASAYISSRAILDYVRGVNLVEGGRVAGAVAGIFGNPNDLALNMVTFLPMAGLLALLGRSGRLTRPLRAAARRLRVQPGAPRPAASPLQRPRAAGRRESMGPRLVGALAAFVMMLAIVFTKSRGGALGLAVALAALVYYAQRVRPGMAVLALVLVVAALPLLPASFWGRMASITNASEDPTGSREARREVMIEAWNVFLERPLTGIGAGQFKNYNPPGKHERWREAHNVWLQVASETGIAGVLAFAFLVVSAFRAALGSKRELARFEAAEERTREAAVRLPSGGRSRPGAAGPPAAADGGVSGPSIDLGILRLQATALVPSLVGWFVCALFASVAYNWTFYYLLGLCIATRQLTTAALAVRTAEALPTGTIVRHAVAG